MRIAQSERREPTDLLCILLIPPPSWLAARGRTDGNRVQRRSVRADRTRINEDLAEEVLLLNLVRLLWAPIPVLPDFAGEWPHWVDLRRY